MTQSSVIYNLPHDVVYIKIDCFLFFYINNKLHFLADVALEGHRTDKKHLSRSEEYQRRVLEAAHNVHVTGFSRNISHEDLNAYFSNFGKVLDVTYIDHNSRVSRFV